MPEKDGKTVQLLYCDLGNGNLVRIDGLTEINDISENAEEDICPVAHWIDEPSISFDINMRRRDHRRLLKLLHSNYMHGYRLIRKYKRAKEKARRSVLKYGSIYPSARQTQSIIEGGES